MSGLIDLDELALRCRNELARRYIEEAIACYKGGAFRSCIVASWNAVVFDFLQKLRELDLAGDKNANKHLQKVEVIRSGGENKLSESLEFEREVLTFAEKEFELITPLEKEDLARLRTDRCRCAHPSMQSLDDVYQPTAELARTHLRNAVEIMLAREPVQGKAAFDSFCNEVKSAYFPTSNEEARKHISSGPLIRARPSLIKSLVIGFLKTILAGTETDQQSARLRSALGAIIDIHRVTAEATLQSHLPTITASVTDGNLWRVLFLASSIDVVWDAIGPACQGKVQRLIATAPPDSAGLRLALLLGMTVPSLTESVLTRADGLPLDMFAKLLIYPHIRLADRVIREYQNAGSFRSAETIGKDLVLPMADIFEASHVSSILIAAEENRQVRGAFDTQEVLCSLLEKVSRHHVACASDWKRFMTFVSDMKSRGILSVRHGYDELRAKMSNTGMWP